MAYKRKRGRRPASSRGKRKPKRALVVLVVIIVILLIIAGGRHHHRMKQLALSVDNVPSFIQVDLLDVNPYSRPGKMRNDTNAIVIHYTANQGSSAKANRDYFNNLQNTHTTKASAHFVVGLDGEVIQCIPSIEVAYASNSRNRDTISIECCYESDDGAFNRETYDSLIMLTAWLCVKYDLDGEDLLRHYDITRKLCPKYYVEHPDAWIALRKDVEEERKDLIKEAGA